MKNKFLLILLSGLFSILFAQRVTAQYTNATLNGPWFMYTVPQSPFGDSLNFLVFDGNGHILDGNMFPAPVKGIYSVNSSGAFTFSMYIGPDTINAGGLLISQNETQAMGGYKMSRVMNPGALTDTLSGTLITNGYGQKTVKFFLNFQGVIIGSTGLTPPVSGRVYAGLGMYIGHVKTGALTSDHWNEFSFFGYYANDTLKGGVSVDGPRDNRREGTSFLVRTGKATTTGITNADGEKTEPMVYPNPSSGRVTVSGLGSTRTPWIYNLTDMMGRTLSTGYISNRDDIDVSSVQGGICFIQLSNGSDHKTIRLVVMAH